MCYRLGYTKSRPLGQDVNSDSLQQKKRLEVDTGVNMRATDREDSMAEEDGSTPGYAIEQRIHSIRHRQGTGNNQ